MTDEQVELLQDLMFKTVPGDLADAEEELRADMKALYAKASKAAKADIAETLAESAIDLKSILPEWNLKNRDRHGDAVCTQGELDEEFDKTVALLKELGEEGEAKRAVAEAEAIKKSNLARICRKTLEGELNTHWGNDYASGLRKAMQKGAILVTTNPVLVDVARKEDPKYWTPVRDALREKLGPSADPVEMAYAMTIQVVVANAKLLRPIWEITDGDMGYVSLQLNPKEARNAQKMIDEATWVYDQLGEELGGTPNTVFKIPGTEGGLQACGPMTAAGMGVNVTVNYSLPQQIAFAGAIEKYSTTKVCFRTQMDGRLDDPVGEELEAAGVSDWEEVKKWATTAIRQREYSMLCLPPEEGGLGFTKSFPLAASGRGPWNILRGTGNGPITLFITVFPDKAEEFDSQQRGIKADGIWTELPKGYLDKLMQSRIFRQAYEPDGMKPSEFIKFVPADRTLKQFGAAYDEFLAWVTGG
ncbi:MAG: hypothetical protein J7M38_08305 [Armatimonadetes bacterium]|nr:hypothetical protein [Armatimonadota bacterium]